MGVVIIWCYQFVQCIMRSNKDWFLAKFVDLALVVGEIYTLSLLNGGLCLRFKNFKPQMLIHILISCTKLQFCILTWSLVIALYRFSLNGIMAAWKYYNSVYLQYQQKNLFDCIQKKSVLNLIIKWVFSKINSIVTLWCA